MQHSSKLVRHRNRLVGLGLAVLISLGIWLLHGLRTSPAFAQPELFEAVWETINENFYDPNFNGLDWVALGEQYRPQVAQAPTRAAKAALINEMLAELKTSHTQLYTPDEPAYYQLLGIFYPRLPELQRQLETIFPEGKVEYVGIGAVTRQKDGKTFVTAILEGSPAAAAGLKVGDEMLSVDGQPFQPIGSFLDKADRPVTLRVQPSPNPESQTELTITPRRYDGITMFLDAMTDSVAVIEKSAQRIGYIHIWSYAGEQYQAKLEEELIYGRLREADALVLDLREGWGGAPPTALHLYTARGPSITNIGRNGEAWTYHGQWNKPVVMLVNENSRSAKEILAYGFQQYDIGPVVGTATPGAVVAGRPFLMPDNSLLYVAVADVYVDDRVRLEGVGVKPDIVVPFPIPYAQGTDPQKEWAITTALELVSSR
jgi:carboxyl-terminal processing protease